MDDNSLGVVAVTGAGGQVGRALLRRLRGRARTIALTRQKVDLPADRVIVGPLDAPAAMIALMEADAIVHLAGALRTDRRNPDRAANLETAETVSRVLREGRARRALFLSAVGASEHAGAPHLRLKARAERVLAEHARELVVFRCSHIIGPPQAPGIVARALLAGSTGQVRVPGDGQQVVTPVYRDDVVAALLAALQGGRPGIYELAGPEQMTLDELVRLLNRGRAVVIRHRPAWLARVLALAGADLAGPLLEALLRDSVGDPTRAVATFGLQLTPLSTIWGTSVSHPSARRPVPSAA